MANPLGLSEKIPTQCSICQLSIGNATDVQRKEHEYMIVRASPTSGVLAISSTFKIDSWPISMVAGIVVNFPHEQVLMTFDTRHEYDGGWNQVNFLIHASCLGLIDRWAEFFGKNLFGYEITSVKLFYLCRCLQVEPYKLEPSVEKVKCVTSEAEFWKEHASRPSPQIAPYGGHDYLSALPNELKLQILTHIFSSKAIFCFFKTSKKHLVFATLFFGSQAWLLWGDHDDDPVLATVKKMCKYSSYEYQILDQRWMMIKRVRCIAKNMPLHLATQPTRDYLLDYEVTWHSSTRIDALRLVTIMIGSTRYVRGLEIFEDERRVVCIGDCTAAPSTHEAWVASDILVSESMAYATDGQGICSIRFGTSRWLPKPPPSHCWEGRSHRNGSNEMSILFDSLKLRHLSWLQCPNIAAYQAEGKFVIRPSYPDEFRNFQPSDHWAHLESNNWFQTRSRQDVRFVTYLPFPDDMTGITMFFKHRVGIVGIRIEASSSCAVYGNTNDKNAIAQFFPISGPAEVIELIRVFHGSDLPSIYIQIETNWDRTHSFGWTEGKGAGSSNGYVLQSDSIQGIFVGGKQEHALACLGIIRGSQQRGSDCLWKPRFSYFGCVERNCIVSEAFLNRVKAVKLFSRDTRIFGAQIFYQEGGSDTVGSVDIRNPVLDVKDVDVPEEASITGIVPTYTDMAGLGRFITNLAFAFGPNQKTSQNLKVRWCSGEKFDTLETFEGEPDWSESEGEEENSDINGDTAEYSDDSSDDEEED